MTDEQAREEEAYDLMELLTRYYHQTDDRKLKEMYKGYLRDIESDLGLLDE